MERGPVALFGAIVAVGLGPALWLGAQLGTIDLHPGERPATVGEQFPDTGRELDLGGVGAGDAPESADPVTRYPRPPVRSATTRATTSAPADPVVERTRSVPVSPSASPSPSDSPTPPAESSSPPPEDPEPSVSPTLDPTLPNLGP